MDEKVGFHTFMNTTIHKTSAWSDINFIHFPLTSIPEISSHTLESYKQKWQFFKI